MSNKNCTYTFTNGQGQKQTIMGMSSMKAFLVDGGLDLFYPSGRFPWLSTESAIDIIQSGPVERRPKLTGANRYGRVNVIAGMNTEADAAAQNKVVDYMNGDISRTELMNYFVASGLPESKIGVFAYRLQEDAPTFGELKAMMQRRENPDATMRPATPDQAAEGGDASNPPPGTDTSGGSVDQALMSNTAPTDEAPKLTRAEAVKLMEWQDMGQKDGIKTHILTFYESQADKDAKRGRMTMATVTQGDRSSDKWTVDGDDQAFTYLAAAKKRGMEVGMAKAVQDGFVEAAEGRAIVSTANDKLIGNDINGNDVFMGTDGPLKDVPYRLDERGRVRTGVALDVATMEAIDKEAENKPASDSLNKPHTIDKKRVLTPSGAISAGARNSDADSSVWYHQGDIKMLAMTASVKIDGQLSKGADEAKRIIEAVSTAQKAGWALRNYRAGTLGTVWTLENGDQFLTRAGLENIDAEQIKDPQIPDYGPGWDNMVRGQKDLAKAVFSWLSTLPPEQRENQATVSRKMADVLGGWAYIERDKLGLHVRYKPSEKPEGGRVSGAQWTHTIPTATDWSHALQIIAELAEGSFDAKPAEESATAAVADAASTTPATDAHVALMDAVRSGNATPEQFKAGFEAFVASKSAILTELGAKTKVQLLREGGPYMQMRYASEKKADVVDAVYRQMLGEYALGESVTYGMGKDSYLNAVRKMVEATDADKLARYVQERNAALEEMKARREAKAAAMQNPQTLEDYREVIKSRVQEGMATKEAFLSLTPEQRIKFDTLAAESTRDARESRKRAMKTRVSAASQTTSGQIIATKHTRDGYDLFVVQLADRLSAEDYKTVLSSAKKLGGWYSSFRGNGATPGFQFKDRASADAFLALAGGDKAAAQNQVEQRRDAFEDDRGQTAVERLRAMADKLEEQANEEEGRDRKANTARRARFASAALAAAAAEKAKAKTMRNIAQAIEDGKAKFLDEVRTKSQVDMLASIVETAKANELRAKYPSYADQEKRKGEPPTAETADFADFPNYSAFRSDLAILGRQLLEVDGTKKLGQRLMAVADDVTDAYLEFAKGNLSKVSQFGRGDALADFGNQQEAERAIKRSGLTGKAIVLQVKRGQNRVILSPSEAIGRGVWTGDGDKRITLTAEFGSELVEAIGRRGNKSNRLTVPWQFQNAYDRRKALSRIGIETASEFRSALREFIDLKEQATANRVRELELKMVGRKADGLDFFPTSAEVADQMVEAADLSPDMAVLEPSAGMGHLADRIREAGAEPDVIELSPDRRELLEEKGYHLAEVNDFMAMEPRKFFTYGDVFRAPDGTEGIMRGVGGMGSQRVRLEDEAGNRLGLYDRDELTGVGYRGSESGYDRIIMNPPFSNRRDAEHVRHAYDLLKPGGRIVAIMGEGVFFGQDKKAQDFREWLESVGGASEKLPEGSFMDPSLPVNTGVNARMVVIDKPANETPAFSRGSASTNAGVNWQPAANQSAAKIVAAGMRAAEKNKPGNYDYTIVEPVQKRFGLGNLTGDRAQGLTDALSRRIRDFEAAFGRRVVFVRADNGSPDFFNGFILPKSDPDTIYVNASADVNLLSILGHEFYEGLVVKNPDLHEWFAEEALKQIKSGALASYATKLAAAGDKQNLDGRFKELLADFTGDALADPEFRRSLARSNPGKFQALIRSFRDFMIRLLGQMRSRAASKGIMGERTLQSSQYFKDVQALRDVLRDVIRQSDTGGNLQQALANGGILFSRSGVDTPWRARWSEQRIDDILGRFAYPADPSRTRAYAATISPVDFLDATTPAVDRAQLEAEAFDLDAERLAGERQPIFLEVKPDESDDGVYHIVGHEGRHRMVALLNAGIDSVPVAIVMRGEAVEDAQIVDEPYFKPQVFKADGTRARRGFEVREMTPISYAFADEIRDSYGRPPADDAVMFSRRAVPPLDNDPEQAMAAAGSTASGFSGLTNKAVDALNDHFGSYPGKLSWWHKTVGSMYNLAERSPAFKRVFDAAQAFINDVSYYGTEAANLAPKILPKLETWRDMAKTPISAEDNQAIAAPIFEGTLSWARDGAGNPVRIADLEGRYAGLTSNEKAQMLLRKGYISEDKLKAWRANQLDFFDAAVENQFNQAFLTPGIVWTPAELKSMFELTDDQIGLYQEFRAATDLSLDNMAKADMLRYGGKDVADLRDAVMEAGTLDDAAEILRGAFMDLSNQDPARSDELVDFANGIVDRAEKVRKLKKQGYAPLSRFGQYLVDVVVDGERQYFSLFESEREAKKMAKAMQEQYGAENVSQGTMSEEEFKLFQGITPETLELFGNALGLDSTGNEAQDQVFQAYLKLTKNNRSAMKRLMHRKGVAGYSEDVGRVLAAFVYSNARQTSAALHIGELGESVNAIPKGQGELKDAAIKLSQYIKEPREEAHRLRGFLFAQYLGGSIASAMVNFTQPLAISIPYLSQFGGLGKATVAWSKAMKDMSTGADLEPDLARALKVAEEQGTVSPQEVHQLMAQARGMSTLKAGDGTRAGDARAAVGNGIAKLALGWGKLFGFAEQVNRRSTFIAAYRLAVENRMTDPAAFATKAVNETQFINNKANKMRWGRGPIGATLMTFKSYSLNWLELVHRLATQNGADGKLAAAYMVGALLLLSGTGGLPFADDLDDLIDGLAQRLGYNVSSKKAKQEFLEDIFGKAGAGFIMRGITGIPGAPVDIAVRMGMGNLLPGTGLFVEKRDHTRDVMEIAGPAGDFITRVGQGLNELSRGNATEAALAVAPKAVSNAVKGADMLNTDMYRDTRGRKVVDTSTSEAISKLIGFQPASVSNVQEAAYLGQRAKDFYSLRKQEISAQWAKGIFEKDPEQIAAAKQAFKDWNAQNPGQRMAPDMPGIVRRVREMRKSKLERVADTSPKGMREMLRRDFSEAQ